ncbi:hypothetical protein A3J41_02715 [candidate division TM6 bacterium RIFCSPHIGHO2_12_FULL_38_8]|nr:MAG: hypothetical protein A3J41_02715 [candidate division TM6 bacterium RIFCSPHIGHO2_12_FULL_38_8]
MKILNFFFVLFLCHTVMPAVEPCAQKNLPVVLGGAECLQHPILTNLTSAERLFLLMQFAHLREEPECVAAAQNLLQSKQVGLNDRDFYGQTPLHWAAGLDSVEMVKMLLQQSGVDMKAQDRFGNTPIHMAVKNRRAYEILNLFREKATTRTEQLVIEELIFIVKVDALLHNVAKR